MVLGNPPPIRSERSLRRAALPALLVLVTVLTAGCSDSKAPSSAPLPTPTGSVASANPVAEMFLKNRQSLKDPTEALRNSLSAGLAGFTTPMSGASPMISLDLTISNVTRDRDLAVLAVIPYQVGNVETGPGARFVPVSLPSLLLKAGESRTVTVEAQRERVGGGGQAPGGQVPAPQMPAARGHLGAPMGFQIAQVGGVSPFDPSQGLQVLVVCQFANEVPAGSWESAQKVSDDEFQRRYGDYAGYQYSIGVPVERLA